jgi:hypothetical protein
MSSEETSAASERKRGGFWSRLADSTIVRILLALVMVIAVAADVQTVFQLLARNPAAKHFLGVTYLPPVVTLAAVLLTDCGFVHWIEKRPVTELSSHGAVPELTLGLVSRGQHVCRNCQYARSPGLLSCARYECVVGVGAGKLSPSAPVGVAT